MNRYLIFFLSILFSISLIQPLWTQGDKTTLTIEYSPNFSKVTNASILLNQTYKLSHNALLRLEYDSGGKIVPTIGLGFFNTGESNQTKIRGESDLDRVKTIENHNYLFIPLGAKISFGDFYVLPEIGLGIKISSTVKTINTFDNGETNVESRDNTLFSGEYNQFSIPFSLSVGKEFMVGSLNCSAGVKGYMGINEIVKNVPRNNHYFGLGILLGVRLL